MFSEQRAATCTLEDARSGGAGWVPCLRAGAHALRMHARHHRAVLVGSCWVEPLADARAHQPQQSSRLVATQSRSVHRWSRPRSERKCVACIGPMDLKSGALSPAAVSAAPLESLNVRSKSPGHAVVCGIPYPRIMRSSVRSLLVLVLPSQYSLVYQPLLRSRRRPQHTEATAMRLRELRACTMPNRVHWSWLPARTNNGYCRKLTTSPEQRSPQPRKSRRQIHHSC
jgi:hypothetical protein